MSAIAALKAARAAGLQLRVWLARHRVRPVAARQDPRAVAEQNDAVGIVGDRQTIERARLRQIVLVGDDAFDPGVGAAFAAELDRVFARRHVSGAVSGAVVAGQGLGALLSLCFCLVGVAGFEPATPSSRTRRAASLRGRRAGGQSAIVCYHFASQLDNTGQDYNERGDCRALERPYILGRSNTTRDGTTSP